mmetsp:Transcript_15007/g.37381  ORF Transcript_15007/g.37381 Transcript_15007/m.37381 type:complete len:291 (+) Transcript_15007:1675-2547(+)
MGQCDAAESRRQLGCEEAQMVQLVGEKTAPEDPQGVGVRPVPRLRHRCGAHATGSARILLLAWHPDRRIVRHVGIVRNDMLVQPTLHGGSVHGRHRVAAGANEDGILGHETARSGSGVLYRSGAGAVPTVPACCFAREPGGGVPGRDLLQGAAHHDGLSGQPEVRPGARRRNRGKEQGHRRRGRLAALGGQGLHGHGRLFSHYRSLQGAADLRRRRKHRARSLRAVLEGAPPWRVQRGDDRRQAAVQRLPDHVAREGQHGRVAGHGRVGRAGAHSVEDPGGVQDDARRHE